MSFVGSNNSCPGWMSLLWFYCKIIPYWKHVFENSIAGLPNRKNDMHARDIAMFALNLLTVINQTRFSTCNDKMIQLRIGINTGKRWGLPVCFNRRRQWLNAFPVGIVLRILSNKVCTNTERTETLRFSKIRTLCLLCCLQQ